MLIDVVENQTKARGRFESVTMVTMAGSSEESDVGDGKPLVRQTQTGQGDTLIRVLVIAHLLTIFVNLRSLNFMGLSFPFYGTGKACLPGQ